MSGILSAFVGGSYRSAPVNTVAPVVTGTATFGQTLSTTNGTWTGAPSPTFTYQWQRSGTNISGATASTYTLVQADVGSTIRCVVTATNSGGSAAANSNSTATVAATVPGAPTSVTASATGSSTASVSWTAPASNGGANITQYNISWTGGSTTSATTSASITGLSPSTSYTFTVTATNSVGTGSGGTSNSITTTATKSYVGVGLSYGTPPTPAIVSPWTSSGFGTNITTTSMTSASSALAITWNPSSTAIFMTANDFSGSYNGLRAAAWNNDTGAIGTIYGSPATKPSVNMYNIRPNPAGTLVSSCSQGQAYDTDLRAWNWSNGWGSQLAGATSSIYNTAVEVTSYAVFYSSYGTTNVPPGGRLLSVASGLGTAFSSPSSAYGNPRSSGGVKPTVNSGGTIGVFTPEGVNGVYVLNQYAISSAGFGSAIANNGTYVYAPGQTAIKYDDTAFAVVGYLLQGGGAPGLAAFTWSNSTAYGTKFSNPATFPSTSLNSVQGVAFTGTGLLVSTDMPGSGSGPFIQGYAFSSSTGFGTLYSASTSNMTGTNGAGAAFNSNPSGRS